MKTFTLPVLLAFLAVPATLLASPDTDRKIEAMAKSSYNFRSVLANEVRARADNGVVTLTGSVTDTDDRDLADETVQNIPGVTGVANRITVTARFPEHSDAWIAFKVRSLLLVKSNVSAAHTHVTVQDAVVTLDGQADDPAQKKLTATYAAGIAGVKSVQNDLVVENQPITSEIVGEPMDDISITSQVRMALHRHKDTSDLKTRITTTDGHIVITGVAASDAEKSLVTKMVMDVRGVKNVRNNMIVRT